MKERFYEEIEYTPGGSGINTMRTITVYYIDIKLDYHITLVEF